MKPVPVIVTRVPPAIGPMAGERSDVVGTGRTVKFSSRVVPNGVVADTGSVPAACAGVVKINDVPSAATSSGVSVIPSNVTVVDPGTKPVPIIVTGKPPPVGPSKGSSDVAVGGP